MVVSTWILINHVFVSYSRILFFIAYSFIIGGNSVLCVFDELLIISRYFKKYIHEESEKCENT